MVYKCSVPFCKGNYNKSTKAHVFRFPRDEILKQKWITAIGRDNFTPSEHARVCDKHFTTEEVLWIASCFDTKNNRLVTAPLSKPHLKEDAVPSIFLQRPENPKLSRKKTVRSTVDQVESNFTEELENCIKQERQVEKKYSNSVEEPRKTIKFERLDIGETNSNAVENVPSLIKQEILEDVGEAADKSSSSSEQERQEVNGGHSGALEKPSSLMKQEVDEDVDSTQKPEEQSTGPYSIDLPNIHQKNKEEPTTSPTISHFGSVIVTLKPALHASDTSESIVATLKPSPEASAIAECKSVVVNLDSSPEVSAGFVVESNFATLKNSLIENSVEMGSPEFATNGKVNNLGKSSQCQVHPKSDSLFNKHKAILTGEAVYKCYQCKQTFHSLLHYRRHKSVHASERKHQCQLCQKRFYSMPHLKRHQSIHSCQKNFQCHLCLKRFAKRCHLETHTVVHTGDKPFKCHLCHKHFSTSSALSMHLISHTGERPFECSFCYKRYSWRSQCHRHEASHSTEKPYKCQLCPQSFSTSYCLEKHQYVHTGKKQFKCNMCPKEFHLKRSLKNHECSYPGITYKCPQCPKIYSQKYSLNKHQQAVHVSRMPIRCQFFVQYKPITFLSKSG